MAIDERARLALYQRLEAVLGPDGAATMMTYLPPHGWGEIAAKGDLALGRGDVERLRVEVGGMRAEFGVLRAEFEDMRADVRAELHRTLRVNMFSLVGFMVALAAAQISAVALLV
jgi:hypothetical protein